MKNQTTPPIAICESNAVDSDQKSKKRWFTLTRQNQKGQVAIFVALIFQVIFVFFALLINVGLLVHHKINLQQSTDLAAYYGAMKQAEMLNVIGHVNFQIRQAWKLLTWRYRVLGTFGQIWTGSGGALNNPDFPLKIGSSANSNTPIQYTDTDAKCNNLGGLYNGNDIPVFCYAHEGFSDWSSNNRETQCKVDCGTLNQLAITIPKISNTGNFNWGAGNVSGAVNSAINTANELGQQLCRKTTLVGAGNLANIIASFYSSVEPKKKLIEIIAKNLAGSKAQFTDLDGNLVELGAKNTFNNNLTEANLKSVQRFDVLNGLSDENPNNNNCSDIETTFNRIKFQMIQYFLRICEAGGNDMQNASVLSVYDPSGNTLHNRIRAVLASLGKSDVADFLNNMISTELSAGFEKNPWCQSYYGVRTSAEPKIPFLPISKIKINAIAFAKPFGGSIGPWYYDRWDANSKESFSANKVDKVLPNKKINAGGTGSPKDNIDIMLNYSNYVGDDLGLRDHHYIAIYHDFLLNRNITAESTASRVHSGLTPSGGLFTKPSPTTSPQMLDWAGITKDMSEADYDPLPKNGNSNTLVRDIEISVVAPNQFDLAYYSIDSDFYNNYYKDKIGDQTKINNLASKYSIPTPVAIFPDFGFSKTDIPGIPKDYSVRHQLAVVEQIFRSNNLALKTVGLAQVAQKYFTFIPKSPASLLTGWTFLNLTNEAGYTTFPSSNGTMKFGQCEDVISGSKPNENYQSLAEAPYNLPSTPGNCITGGRTGYSVKIVSQEALTGNQGPIGGPGTSGPIRNPIPASFLNF